MMKKKTTERRDGVKKTSRRRQSSPRLGPEAVARRAEARPAGSAADAGERPDHPERTDNKDGRLHRPGRDVPQPPAPVAPAAPEPAAVAALAGTLGRELAPEQAVWLAGYLDDLHRWNRVMNLVGTRDWRETLETLVADSWHLGDFLAEVAPGRRAVEDDSGELGSVDSAGAPDGSSAALEARKSETPGASADPRRPLSLDLGAGAGLPGLPLRQFWTAGEYWLVEIRQKRASFMQGVLARRRLDRTRVFAGSVEDLPHGLTPADLVLSRAFRPWREVLAIAAGLVRREKGWEGLVVILANQPPPEAEVEVSAPLGAVRFRLVAERAYDVAGGRRYFWAFTPTSMPR